LNVAQISRDLIEKTQAHANTIALMRLVLAALALVLLSFYASGYATPQADAYDLLLLLYFAYAAIHYFAPNFIHKIIPQQNEHWVDLACFTLLVGLSGGFSSPIMPFFLFAILIAAFRFGFNEGFKVTLVCVVIVALIHILPLPKEAELPLFPALIHETTLLVIAYFIACWGGLLLQQKRQLDLLREVNSMPDPRLSVEQLLGNSLETIRTYYKANACIVVLKMHDDAHVIFKVTEGVGTPSVLGQLLDDSIAIYLLAVPPQWAMNFCNEQTKLTLAQQDFITDEPPPTVDADEMQEQASAIAELLEVDSFVSMPLSLHGQYVGRLYLTSSNHAIDKPDIPFLQLLVNQITSRIDIIQLSDKIAASASASMRQKIAIDLHDSTIQPYIGLKLGLEALRRKLTEDNAIAADVDELVNMTTESISSLRQYIGGLKAQLVEPLVPALLELAKNYQRRHGIEVTVNADSDLKINERMAAEIYQLVAEGLSNVRRHTKSKHAIVNIRYQEEQLVVEMANECHSKGSFKQFKPRSMTERATNLGGTVSVHHQPSIGTVLATTIVSAEIPLQTKDRRKQG
jgi:signal transduction histidine kinase